MGFRRRKEGSKNCVHYWDEANPYYPTSKAFFRCKLCGREAWCHELQEEFDEFDDDE
eukprot:g58800.t1